MWLVPISNAANINSFITILLKLVYNMTVYLIDGDVKEFLKMATFPGGSGSGGGGTTGSGADAGFSFKMVFDTQTTTSDPGTGKCNFASSNTVFVISETSVEGLNLLSYFGTILRGQMRWRSTTEASAAWGIFDVSGTNDPGSYWTFPGTLQSVGGALPVDGEEIEITYVHVASASDVVELAKEAFFVRYNTDKQLLDKDGVPFSGTAEVADMTALLALDEATYENYVVTVDGLPGKPAFKSDGTTWLPLNGIYGAGSSNVSVRKVICANQVTWTISNNGGFVRLTGTAHGLTAAANGYQLYATNTTTNIPSGTFLTVTYVDANTIQTDLAFTSTSGNPTFAQAGSTVIPVLALTVPPLRTNSRYLVEGLLKGQADASATTNRLYAALGAVDITQSTYSAASNTSSPFRTGFMNVNSVSSQRGLFGKSSSGTSAASDPITHTLDTSTGTQVYTLSLYCAVVNFGVELANYNVEVRN